jgi:methylthioribose-1-phosphate isomerase
VEIEERGGDEVTHVAGEGGSLRITASAAANPAFDITPARLVTGYLTERGLLDAV